VTNEDRRQLLRTGARYLFATALGALAVSLGLRRGGKTAAGYCERAGRCGGCEVTADCDTFQAMHGREP
jgi:hypothetical protein